MPIYEYRCAHCGFEKEFLQKISDPLLKTCPQCHQDQLVKKVSAAGFQLKGSGWYATDFRSSGSGGSAQSAETSGPEAAKDSTPETGKAGAAEATTSKASGHACGSGGCGACS